MKIVTIADTHGLHDQLDVPDGDLLVHAGDFTHFGDRAHEEAFADWMGSQPHNHKVVIYGNHEVGFDQRRRMRFREDCFQRGVEVLSSERQTIRGVTLYALGFPISTMPVQDDRYDDITDDVDVLISHAPPRGILDESIDGSNYGDEPLRQKLRSVTPTYHLFGHVHASYGMKEQDGTTYVNAALKHDDNLDEPICVTIDVDWP